MGLVSGGAGECGGPSLPGVFTRTDIYQPWIQAALEEVDRTGSLPQVPGQQRMQQLARLVLPAGDGVPATEAPGDGEKATAQP